MNKKVVSKYIEEELKNYEETIRQMEAIRFEILNTSPLKQIGKAGMPDPTAVKAITLVSNTVLSRMERTVRAIERMILSVNKDQQKLFRLKYIEQKTKQQICKELAISERTYQRWSRKIIGRVAEELGLTIDEWQKLA